MPILPEDPSHVPPLVFPSDPPTILEGSVATPQQKFPNGGPGPNDQSPSEVSEEDFPWNHYTHDKTINVIPDPGYKHLLSSYLDQSTPSVTLVHPDMEVEWENASAMREHDGVSDRTLGGQPEWAWPSVGDRVWIDGRWVFDCGHLGLDSSSNPPLTYLDEAHVNVSTEIHPPRAVVVFRNLAHGPTATVAGSTGTGLGVTGSLTNVPVTQADMFVSGNGGGANQRCEVNPSANDCSAFNFKDTGPLIPVNDRNYVFDVYPPGTDFNPNDKLPNGTWPVTPPTSDSSLQWRTLERSIPPSACPGGVSTACVQPERLFCPIDGSTPAPDQTETTCPTPPASPTRLRVILLFQGTPANVFAKSLFLGWDDVPRPPAPPVRTFKISLHEYRVLPGTSDEDWRVFVGVGGEWRYMSGLPFDQPPGCTAGDLNSGLLNANDGDCFGFDSRPWTVSVQDGTPIHVAVGGYESDTIDSDFCRPGNCTYSPTSQIPDLALNDDRLGTIEYDLIKGQSSLQNLPSVGNYGVGICPCTEKSRPTTDGEQFQVTFTVEEVPSSPPPVSDPLTIGGPQYTAGGPTYVTSSTPLTLSTQSPDLVGFQYRTRLDGAPLPTYFATLGFPVHWTATDFQAGPRAIPISLTGADGGYTLQYSAQTADSQGNPLLTEPRNTAHLVLDNTPPTITITQPTATNYTHSSPLTLNYGADDGSGSGVRSVTALLDGSPTTPAGQGLQSGQTIPLLTSGLALGPHTFTVKAVDNVGNATTSSVTFTIIVTAQSIKDDVSQFVAAGAITLDEGTSVLATLNAAAKALAAGDCTNATKVYRAFVHEVQAQTGKKITASAAAVLIADAQYLIAHCP